MHKLRILILYPDPAGLALLTSMLKSLGHIIEEATNDRVGVKLMERNNIDLVLAGVDPLDGEALELLTYVRRKHREVPVILLVSAAASRTGQGGAAAGSDGRAQVPGSRGRAACRRAASPRAVRGPGSRASGCAPHRPRARSTRLTTRVSAPAPSATTDHGPATAARTASSLRRDGHQAFHRGSSGGEPPATARARAAARSSCSLARSA